MRLFRKKQPQQGPQIDMQAFQAIRENFGNAKPIDKRETKLMDHERMLGFGINNQMVHKAKMNRDRLNKEADQVRASVPRPSAPQYTPTTDDVLADIESVVSPYSAPMASAASPYIEENAANQPKNLYIKENEANQPKNPWEGAFWDDLLNRLVPEAQAVNEPPAVTKPYASSAGFGIRINDSETRLNKVLREAQAARMQQELVDAGVRPFSQRQSTWDMLPYDQRTAPFVSPIPDPLDTQLFEPYTEFDYRESMQDVPYMDNMSVQQLMAGR